MEWRTYSDDIKSSPIQYFLDAIDTKYNKLNSTTANYREMERYDLFVISLISIPFYQQFKVAELVFDKLNAMQGRKFTTVYLLTLEEKLFAFHNQSKWSTDEKYLYNNAMDRFVDDAIKESRSEAHDQT